MARPSREPQILAAALSVFVERGYDATRTRQIAERAGVSDAGLYSHFSSKEELALALFRLHYGRYSDLIAEVTRDRELSVQHRVEAVARETIRAFVRDPEAVAFVVTHQARFIGVLPADFPFTIRIVESLMREGQRDGSVRKGSVRLLASLVFGCAVQPIRTVLEAPPGTITLDTAAARETIAEAAWNAIASSR